MHQAQLGACLQRGVLQDGGDIGGAIASCSLLHAAAKDVLNRLVRRGHVRRAERLEERAALERAVLLHRLELGEPRRAGGLVVPRERLLEDVAALNALRARSRWLLLALSCDPAGAMISPGRNQAALMREAWYRRSDFRVMQLPAYEELQQARAAGVLCPHASMVPGRLQYSGQQNIRAANGSGAPLTKRRTPPQPLQQHAGWGHHGDERTSHSTKLSAKLEWENECPQMSTARRPASSVQVRGRLCRLTCTACEAHLSRSSDRIS